MYIKNYIGKIKLSRENRKIAIVFMSLTVLMMAFTIYAGQTNAFANEYYWQIKAGDKVLISTDSSVTANSIVNGIKEYYLTDGSKVNSVKCDPQLVAEEKIVSSSSEQKYKYFTNPKKAIQYLITGTATTKTYKVKDGDIAWNIALDNDFTYEELQNMNSGVNLELIHKGDTLKLYEMKPFVKITTNEVITKTSSIASKTKYINDSDLLKGQTKVKIKGSAGKKEVTAKYIKVNGKTVKKVILSSKVLKKPRMKVVYRGTKVVSPRAYAYSDGVTYSGSGSAVANFALNYVGYPYAYGGTSLTHGCDCSGFVLAVYEHFGISLPHGATTMESYGRGVSLSQAQPGDIMCYGNHVGIYIGGGRMVHASNEIYDICVSEIYYDRIRTIRRIFE